MLGLKPTHKVIREFYQAMNKMRETGQTHETAVAPYFANILRHCAAKTQRLDLVEQFPVKREGRRPLRADGGLVDRELHFFLYGLWEAKDSQDDLEKEINKKIHDDDYPNENILFQSPERIVLYQSGVLKFDKSIVEDKQALIDGLGLFFSYNNELHTEWAEVVEHFQGKVGDLGTALVKIIEDELKASKKFKAAFNDFLELCRGAINPNIAHAAVVEMLVQHLLTERLFRTVFDNPDFVQKNVIAREIEKVIEVLAQRSFNRAAFLFGVERFYTVIEKTAAAVHNYDDKQTFLNVVYERFFQGFAVKVADTHGIVYTPQEIVSFMVQSVEDILKVEFDKDLSSEGVHVLDPFVGTGNFILRVMEQIDLLKLENKYKQELHCNEVLLLPYYIASMNIEHTFFEKMSIYQPFEGVCLVDTFEILEAKQQSFSMFSPENSERVKRQQQTPLFVIIGNPPYNVGQINENDNNKNRKYKTVDALVSDSYAKDSKATNKNALSDVYVKAFAWATERLKNQADGVVAFVTNNSFVEGLAFDGMRKQLAAEFDKIYIFDLKGNVRKSIGVQNVFNIRVGVSIIFLIKKALLDSKTEADIFYYSINDDFKRVQKLEFIAEKNTYENLEWQEIKPDEKYNWLTEGLYDDFKSFLPMGTKEAKTAKSEAEDVIFKIYSNGVKTNRDIWVYNFNAEVLAENMQKTIEFYNVQLFKLKTKEKPKNKDELANLIDDFAIYDDTKISWSRDLKLDLKRENKAVFNNEKIRTSLYRPFTKSHLFFDRIMNEEVYVFPSIFPTPETEAENKVICVAGIGDRKGFGCMISNTIIALDFAFEKAQCFPFYTYSEDGSHRQENISNWALKDYQTHYQDNSISKWDIFYYVYGFLHHQGYRDKYQANLKRELPRIPYAPEFWTISHAGKQLADLHLNYEQQKPYEIQYETKSKTPDWHVKKMRLNKEKTSIIYNDTFIIKGIPPQVFDYKLGNRSALHWIIDQYQVKTDKRSGITNDPNRDDDPQYIIKLIGKIITVSLKTVEIVEEINKLDFE